MVKDPVAIKDKNISLKDEKDDEMKHFLF